MTHVDSTGLLTDDDGSDIIRAIAFLSDGSRNGVTVFAVSAELANRHIDIDPATVFGEIEAFMASGLLRSIGGDLRLTERGADVLSRLFKDGR